MMNRGKKIVAVALALAMMIPFAFSQTTVTKAAETPGQTPVAKTTKDVLSIGLAKGSSNTFARGETVVLSLQATEAISSSKMVGTLSFLDSNNKKIENAFSLVKVIGKRWHIGYDTDSLSFALHSNSVLEFSAQDEIAQIELKVQKDISAAKVAVSFESRNLDIRADNDSTIVTATAPTDDLSCDLTSSIKDTRGVDLELPAKLKQAIYTFSSTGVNNLREFTVPVSIKSNTGFNAITIQFSYNTSQMTYKGYQLTPKALMSLSCITEYQGVTTDSSGATQGYVSLSFAGTEDT